jgi:hypothetical protein
MNMRGGVTAHEIRTCRERIRLTTLGKVLRLYQVIQSLSSWYSTRHSQGSAKPPSNVDIVPTSSFNLLDSRRVFRSDAKHAESLAAPIRPSRPRQ